ncbi:hemolysin secretion protein D [Terrihabitans soli]|uniref:Hemolysin secretion protein D n=1 Tax=Terrihabitans soli TaxID=708113 RepID=A0A6S6QTZ3_9HYPH|nr:efflux RND transporter periplasmic adaptor subunit [Terrihabitans soli]BCJ90420.1 hemolysin secretion protein D [Terrihabitans soli]
MRRSFIIAGIALAAVVLGGGWLVFGGSSDNADAAPQTAEKRAPSVSVVRAARREISEEAHVSGTLVAREEVMVSPEVEGLAVTEILVEEGDRVEKGQVLARLSKSALDAEAAQAQASIAQAQAQIAEAEANVAESKLALERAETLVQSKTIAKAAYDQRLATSRVSEARQRAAEHNLKVAQAQSEQIAIRLARTEIKAPTGGVVSRRTIRLGAIASMAAEPSFRIIEAGAIELQADVVDSTLVRFQTGQSVRVTTAGLSTPLSGTIRLISSEVDPATRLGKLRVALPLDAKVTIGSFASGVVEVGRQTAVTVPISAITVSAGKSTVQVVIDNKIATREVTIGLRSATRAEIKSGLAENELVVSRAGSFLRDGDAVTPIETNEAEAAR